MRKTIIVLVAVLVAGSAMAGSDLVRSHLTATVQTPMSVDIAGLKARLTALYGTDVAASYVGTDYCQACHGFSNFKGTRHAQMLRRPLGKWTLVDGKGVIANQAHQMVDDFQYQLDLALIGSFSAYGANAPKLSYDAATDTYWMTIGALKCKVVATIAGSSDQDGQRYLLRVPVTDTDTKLSKALYYAPATYSRTQGWMPASGWYDSSYNPKFGTSTTSSQLVAAGGPTSHTRNCVGCHVTGIRSLTINAAGEAVFQGYVATLYQADDPMYVDYNGDGNLLLTSIGCESCHGPGANHVMSTDKVNNPMIVNPGDLTGAESAEICGACHTNVKSLPNKTWGWPYHDDSNTMWQPKPVGTTWEPVANAGAFSYSTWGDGVLPSGHIYQYSQYLLSAHSSTHFGQNGSSEPCSECHSGHSKRQEAQIRTSITDEATGLRIPTSPENDTLCLACHATHGPFAGITKAQVADYANNEEAIGAVVAAHANHPYAPERTMGLGNCIECHMSTSAGHTWFVTKPEDTITYATSGLKNAQGAYIGYPNACAESCHATRVNIFGLGYDPNTSVWTAKFDTDLASILKTYYGPDGLWWNTTPTP
jgi:hypothetical protein